MRIVVGTAKMNGLLTQFRGCLVGGLVGDCVSEPFDYDRNVRFDKPLELMVPHVFDKLVSRDFDHMRGATDYLEYTDDTEMTWKITESLVSRRCFEPADIAKKFCKVYYEVQDQFPLTDVRKFGASVVDVFAKWRSKLGSWSDVDPYEAAREQFNGSGSYGCGGAIRVSPIALFTLNKDYDEMIKLAEQSALLTHTHRDGVNGALLQCIALRQVLIESKVSYQLDPKTFIDQLIERMKPLEPPAESEDGDASMEVSQPYTYKLMLMKKYLSSDVEISTEEIAETLGNYFTAPKCVPTAIYCFLKNVSSEPDQPGAVGRFERTLRYAFTLGGFSNSIAAMAGNLAGAYYGFEAIPYRILKLCESKKSAIQLADKFHSLVCCDPFLNRRINSAK